MENVFLFVTDVLGGGGLGFNLGRGRVQSGSPVGESAADGRTVAARETGPSAIRIAEPMEEICYLDAVRLVAYDLPPGWEIVLDERFAAAPPDPTGQPLFFRRELLPVRGGE